jgi:acyl-CoA hydrolase
MKDATTNGAGDAAGAEVLIRLRLGPADARYGGDLVAGATAMAIFGDLETELAIRTYGDEGLCVAYHSVEFLAPLRPGDFIEGRARIVSSGRTSRRIKAELHKVIGAEPDGRGSVLDPPILAARAEATIVSGRRGAG